MSDVDRIEALELAVAELSRSQWESQSHLKRMEAVLNRWRVAAIAAALLAGVLIPQRIGRTATVAAPPVNKRIKALEMAVFGVSPVPAGTSDRISAETAARQKVDGGLQAGLTAEATSRQAANTALQAAITAETNARIATDTTLQTAITTESNARTATDTSLQGAVDAEASARAAADNLLNGSVGALSADLSLVRTTIDPFFSRVRVEDGVGNRTEIIFEGANVHLRNALGATNGKPNAPFEAEGETNGLGNLIIGYNESDLPLNRGGSHNLVFGINNAYRSFGGFVAGVQNDLAAPYATIAGGLQNRVNGIAAAISGGGGLVQNSAGGWSGGLFHSP